MKRAGNLMKQISCFDNLQLTCYNAKNGEETSLADSANDAYVFSIFVK